MSTIDTSTDDAPRTISPRFVDWKAFTANPYRYHPDTKSQNEQPTRPLWEPDTNNATFIGYQWEFKKGTPEYKRYQRLDFYNQGGRNGEWTNNPLIGYELNRWLIMALATQADLTKQQTWKVYHRFMSLNLREWGVRAELVAFCVLTVTVHQDETIRTYHYNQKPENRDSLLSWLAESIGLRDRDIQRVYAKLEQYFRHLDSDQLKQSRSFELPEGYIRGMPFSLLRELHKRYPE